MKRAEPQRPQLSTTESPWWWWGAGQQENFTRSHLTGQAVSMLPAQDGASQTQGCQRRNLVEKGTVGPNWALGVHGCNGLSVWGGCWSGFFAQAGQTLELRHDGRYKNRRGSKLEDPVHTWSTKRRKPKESVQHNCTLWTVFSPACGLLLKHLRCEKCFSYCRYIGKRQKCDFNRCV